MFDWEPVFCHLVVSHHCAALRCAIMCAMLKSALPTQRWLKQDSCPDAVDKNLVCLLFTVLGKASFVGSHPLRKISASLSWWEGLVVALGEISVQRLSREEIHSLWQRLVQGGGLWREREGGPCRAVVSRANPVPPACLAKWKCSSSLPKNVMWQHADIPLFLAAKAAMSSVLSFLAEARLLDCSATSMKWCAWVKNEARFQGLNLCPSAW